MRKCSLHLRMLCSRSGQPQAWYHISYLNTRESRSLPPRAHRGSSSEGLLVELPVAGTARRLQWRTKDTRVLRPLRLATRPRWPKPMTLSSWCGFHTMPGPMWSIGAMLSRRMASRPGSSLCLLTSWRRSWFMASRSSQSSTNSSCGSSGVEDGVGMWRRLPLLVAQRRERCLWLSAAQALMLSLFSCQWLFLRGGDAFVPSTPESPGHCVWPRGPR